MRQSFSLSNSQRERARRAADGARSFEESAEYSLGVAMIDHAWNDGPAVAVVTALGAYVNDDGGIGRGLEVDIGAPASNPFAARLAMIILLNLDGGGEARTNLETAMGSWLVANQAEDGDWHFSDETRSGELAPWFAGWSFPSLNPACCVAALANRLGIATPGMLDRVAGLFSDKASLDTARSGDFYGLLPYTEYAGGIEWDDRDEYLAAITGNIVGSVEAGTYADAGHFWEHVLGGGPDLVARIPADVLSQQSDRLLSEQSDDGGCPNPYNDAWRPYFTAQSCVTLARLRDGI